MSSNFIDTNIWLYRLLDDERIESQERERKRKIAIDLTENPNLIISTQVVNEICVNLLKKAHYNEQNLKLVIQSLYNRCLVVQFSLEVLENASNLRGRYNFSFWDSLIVSSALCAEAVNLYSEDMQDGLRVANQLLLINPFKQPNQA